MTELRGHLTEGERRVQTRIGIATLTKLAFAAADLEGIWNELLDSIARDPSNTAAAMDMSAIAQLLGDQKSGLALQSGALKFNRLYRSPSAVAKPSLRVLALAADTDIGGNTPIDFLLEESDVELYTLYIVPGIPLPNPLPEHDIAFVVAPASKSTREALDEIATIANHWPKLMLNAPARIAELDRDRLHFLLKLVPGLRLPMTAKISREQLLNIGRTNSKSGHYLDLKNRPLILRPVDSHAGRGLIKIDELSDVEPYLAQRGEEQFFLSRYIDYRSADGLFRKYRIVFIDGSPYACHMATSDRWDIWYLNAGMEQSEVKRAEEAQFMATFDCAFRKRHRIVLDEIARRVGLEYFAIDCAETVCGDLLLFEADNAMIVHDMDPPSLYPYKSPQMRKIFEAFVAMLHRHAQRALARVA